MRLKRDSTCNEDLQAGRAWGALGFKIADEIDRAMCAAEGIAALQRAADLVTLADLPYLYALRIWHDEKGVQQVRIDGVRESVFNPYPLIVFARSGPDAIAEAAAWVRQRGGA
jgi:hypothetical protein